MMIDGDEISSYEFLGFVAESAREQIELLRYKEALELATNVVLPLEQFVQSLKALHDYVDQTAEPDLDLAQLLSLARAVL